MEATPKEPLTHQLFADIIELKRVGGIEDDTLLLLLSLVNCFCVIDLIRQRPQPEEPGVLDRLIRSMATNLSSYKPNSGSKGYPLPPNSGEGLPSILSLILNNKELIKKILPLMQQILVSPGVPKTTEEPVIPSAPSVKETPPLKRNKSKEILRWDFCRSESIKQPHT